MVYNLGLQLRATLFGGECSRLCMCPPDSPPTYRSPIKSNVNAYYFPLFAKYWVRGGMELLMYNLYQFQLLCCMSTQ